MKRLILLLTVCLLTLCFCSGCMSSGVKSGKSKKEITAELTQSLESALKSPSEMVEGEEVPSYLSYMEQNNSFEIISYEESDGIVSATIKVTAPDLYTAVQEASSDKAAASGEADELITSKLREVKSLEQTVKLSFASSAGSYKPLLTDDFLDAYYGGIFRLREKTLLDYAGSGEVQ